MYSLGKKKCITCLCPNNRLALKITVKKIKMWKSKNQIIFSINGLDPQIKKIDYFKDSID